MGGKRVALQNSPAPPLLKRELKATHAAPATDALNAQHQGDASAAAVGAAAVAAAAGTLPQSSSSGATI
ncbi:hypothetical protein ACP4OV_029844 [Aristida adscensionis]